MFGHNASNNKIGQNDNADFGSDKNKKTKSVVKNVVDNRNSQNTSNNISLDHSSTLNKADNIIYLQEKAKEDSKYDHFFKLNNDIENTEQEIYNLRDKMLACAKCKKIFSDELIECSEKLQKQNLLRNGNYGILPDTIEAKKLIIGNPPVIVGPAIAVEAKLVQYQKDYISNLKSLWPTYYYPCSKHALLQREHQKLLSRLDRLNSQLSNSK